MPLSVIRARNLCLVSSGAQTALFQGSDCKVAPFPAAQANQMHTRSLRILLEILNFWPNEVLTSATYSRSLGHMSIHPAIQLFIRLSDTQSPPVGLKGAGTLLSFYKAFSCWISYQDFPFNSQSLRLFHNLHTNITLCQGDISQRRHVGSLRQDCKIGHNNHTSLNGWKRRQLSSGRHNTIREMSLT